MGYPTPSFRDGALAPDPESRDSPMCNCTSEVRACARPRMTVLIQDYALAAFAASIACQTFSGDSGVLIDLMPSSLSASITPLVMQGGPPIAPDSPQPLAPSGLVRQGAESSSVTSIGGMSSARGRQ